MQRLIVRSFALVCLLAAPSAAVAQERPSRPYRGLFGGGVGNTEQHLTLSFGSVGGADKVLAGQPESGDLAGVPSESTTFGSWTGSADYGLSRSRFSVSASLSGYSRFGGEGSSVARDGGVNGQWQMFRRTSLGGGASMSYEPLSVLSFFPTLPGSAVESSTFANYTLGDQPNVYTSDAAHLYLTHQLSRRSTLTMAYSRQRVGLTEETGPRAVQSASIDFGQQLTRNLSLRLGYYEGRGAFGLDEEGGADLAFKSRTLNLGVDYSGSLELSRRTTLAISTGTAVLSDEGTQRFHVTATAALQHEIGRSWNVAVNYDRTAGFHHVVRDPSFTDSAIGSLNGLLARRVNVHASLGASTGSVGLRAESSYTAYHGGAGLSLAASRFLSFRLNYTYYRFDAANTDFLPLGLDQLSRHGIVGGVDVFAPLFVRARRGNVAR